MKSFLKYTLATIVGVIIVHILMIFIFFGFIGIIASFGDKPAEVKNNSILHLQFKGNIPDRASANPMDNFNFMSMKSIESTGLNDILKNIGKAQKDDRIKGIYLDLTEIESNFGGLATTVEIRNALQEFKASGKFIYSYSNLGYSQKSYYLATIADSVFVNPESPLILAGMGGTSFFYKDMLDKIGLKVDIVKVGKYKSAVEPFTQTEMSPANREQMTECLESVWNRIQADVSDSRHIPTDTLNAYADRYMDFCQAEEYVQCGLADTLMYKDEVISYLKQLSGRDEDDKLNSLFIEDMINVKKNVPKDKSGNVIAVYYAYGEILDAPGSSTEDCIDVQKMCKGLRKLRDNDDVKAVVLRVNSPGGSAYGSDQIWREVVRLKEKKPVIVSMGDYAASGGYYISCAADRIFADPTTLTGSIGIFGMMYSGEKLFTETLGLNFDVVKTNKMADLGASLGPILTRPLNASEQELMQNYVNRGYKLFVSRCAEGRKMSTEAIEKVAEGRVWTGAMAKDLGLVDELGGIDKALNAAATQAGIENYSIIGYPEKENIFASLLGNQKKHYVNSEIKEYLGSYYNSFKALENIKNANCIQARMPFDPNIQ